MATRLCHQCWISRPWTPGLRQTSQMTRPWSTRIMMWTPPITRNWSEDYKRKKKLENCWVKPSWSSLCKLLVTLNSNRQIPKRFFETATQNYSLFIGIVTVCFFYGFSERFKFSPNLRRSNFSNSCYFTKIVSQQYGMSSDKQDKTNYFRLILTLKNFKHFF